MDSQAEIYHEKQTHLSFCMEIREDEARTVCEQGVVSDAPIDHMAVAKPSNTTFTSITIFYYKTTLIEEPFRGIPVALNFTDTDSFLRCQKSGDEVSVSVEKFEKQRLQRFSSRDEDAFSFVFYMRGARDKVHHFESAVHSGWFMKAVDETVGMGPLSPESESSYFMFHEQ